MTDREFAREMMLASAPRFDGMDADRLSWMKGHYEYRYRHRRPYENEPAPENRDWWQNDDERWR